MEKARSAQLGPRAARTPSGRRLSATRAALLETLQAQPEPTGLSALVLQTGLHANTVREHLAGLQRSGLVARSAAPSTGRGRPGWLYSATRRSRDDPRPEYAGLAATLAAVVARTSPDPARDAREAGAEWGRRLAREAGPPAQQGEEAARHAVTDLFTELGFGPEADAQARELRLTRCPLLEAAYQQTEVVCSVHLGVAEGALETYGAPTDELELEPFVEPGACVMRLCALRT